MHKIKKLFMSIDRHIILHSLRYYIHRLIDIYRINYILINYAQNIIIWFNSVSYNEK